MLVLGCIFAVFAAAEVSHFDISTEVATPHIPWAKPLEGGALRMLAIVPRQGLRDVIELTHRLETQHTIVPLWSGAHLGYNPAAPETHVPGGDDASVADAVRKGLDRRLDVVLIAGCDLDTLPEALQQAVIDRVHGGTGLVVVQVRGQGGALKRWLDALAPDDNREIVTRGLALRGTPGWTAAGDFVATSALDGKGRVVQVVYPDSAPWTHSLVPGRPFPNYSYADYLDDHLALLVRALRWAGGREPSQRIGQIASAAPAGPDEEEIPPGFPEEYLESIRDSMLGGLVRPFRLFLETPAEDTYQVRIVVRDPETGMRVANTMNSPLRKGQFFYNFDLFIGAGTYRFDAFILNRGRVVDFFTRETTVEAWPEIEAVDYAKTYLMPHDTLDLKVKIGSVLGMHRNATVYVRAVDNFGRKVASSSQITGHEGGEVPIRLNLADLIAPLLRVEVFALDGEHASPSDAMAGNFARQVLYFPVRNLKPPWNMGAGAALPVMGEANAQRFLRELWRQGMRHYTNTHDTDEMLHGAMAGLAYSPNLRATDSDAGGFVTSGERADAVRQDVLNAWAGGSGQYWLGAHTMYGEREELAFLESGDSAAFLKGLQNYFPELEMLNAAWKRRFILWDGVEPSTRDDVRTSGLYANWMGLRRVLDDIRSGGIEAARRFVHTIDTEGRAGIVVREDPTEPLATPWPLVMRVSDGVLYEPATDFWPLALSQISSFKERHQRNGLLVRAEWLETPEQRQSLPWYAVFHQINDLWAAAPFLFADLAVPAPVLLPDGRVNPTWRDVLDEHQRLQYGPGEAVMRARRVHDRVGLYYSRASHALNAVEQGFECDSREAEWAWLQVLDALGCRSLWLDEVSLRRGLGEVDVIVLPAVRAMGDDEIDALYEFIRRGGHIIADIAPGLYTEYGVMRDHSPFAGVMGAAYMEEAEGGVVYRAVPGMPGLPVDTHHTPDTALRQDAEAGAPLWLEYRDESYAALLLNHVAGNAQFREAMQRKLPAWTAVAKRFLEAAGVAPSAFRSMESALGFDGMAACFDLDSARITLAFAHPEAVGRQTFEPRFDEDTQVYDMFTGVPVRRPNRSSFALAPGAGVAFAALPYAVEGLELNAPEDTPNGQRLNFQVVVSTKGEGVISHPVLVELRTLQGEPLPHYRHLLWCANGLGSHYFPIAHNDQIGTCVLHARDLLSGTSQEIRVNVGNYRRPANVIQGRVGN